MSAVISAVTPRIYVGTYAKYNGGSIEGKWLNLEDCADKNAFLAACAVLHKDEADPEFMFQDCEGIPDALYSESSVSDALFAYVALDEGDRELLAVYNDNVNQDGGIDEARESFAGKADSEAAFAQELLEDTGGLEGVPEHLKNYIDYEAYARDLRMGGDYSFVRHEGDLWVFRSN